MTILASHALLAAAFDGSGLTTFIRALVGNLFLAAVGMAAVGHLFKKELVRFFEFVTLAVLAGTFVYTPEVWRSVAETVAATFKG